MNQASLLIELFTEELPPKALSRLGQSFADGIFLGLKNLGLANQNSIATSYASPRRLAVHITNVLAKAPDRQTKEKLLPVSIALDANGQATPPLLKKLAALGHENINLNQLERQGTDKAEAFYINLNIEGETLKAGLQSVLEQTISKLPIPKVMRYQINPGTPQAQDVEFVRPAHGLVALHGSSTIPVNCLGLQSSNITWGHRFLSTGSITIDHADNYASLLEVQGKVLANFEARLEKIKSDLMAAANGLEVLMPQSLLEEVCSLVEWPVVYPCQFEKEFLDVPQECLILTMQTNQKYFALTDQSGKLSNKFLIVSNLATKTPEAIISGNERVVRPRLSDAKFFFEQDRKKPLAQRTPLLSKVVYHNKLGTQLERTERIQHIAKHIAQLLGQPIELAQKAALLAKADLLTDMVGEFPELQGIMGRYYATHDGEHADVAAACMEHYLPRFAGDSLPQTSIGMILALADKLETLVGIWGIGLAPTGEKDPFALRRHALGICRILIEKHLNLDIVALIEFVKSQFSQTEVQTQAVVADIHQFILDRLRAYLKDQQQDGEHYSTNEVESVASQQPRVIADVLQRLQAVRKFSSLPEAQSLAAANKRIGNILKKADFEIPAKVDDSLLSDGAEKQLADSVKKVMPLVQASFSQGDYTQGLISFASLKDPVDQFFNDVMVMDPNTRLRDNRLALLREMHTMMNQVADIGKLAS